jgi:diaminohydroxyphosphoribosylaminopyrimidine deaminase/5-amino-6-(5-phosphoribosylamino)uracil reductase
MAQALEIARQHLGVANPNPMVGAVLVRNGKVIATGYSQAVGGPHAEIVALRAAGEAARGATLYVTLEPCSHHGRTPPCVQAVIAAGVASIHVACLDPNPKVLGMGLATLIEAGAPCVVGEREVEARDLIEAHTKWTTSGRPYVTAKFAMSLDGKTATRAGDSRWITGPESRALVHRVRRTVDAIVVGIGTALADDPQLTARDGDGKHLPRQPLRVVLDSQARLPPTARMLREPGRTVVAVARAPSARVKALEAAGATVLHMPGDAGGVDVEQVLEWLGRREVPHVLIEGGGRTLASFLERRLIDKVMAFVAPVLIGGDEAPSPVRGAGVTALADALRLRDVRTERVGDDVLIIGKMRRSVSPSHARARAGAAMNEGE